MSRSANGQSEFVAQELRDLQWALESPSLLSLNACSLKPPKQTQWEAYQPQLLNFLDTRTSHRVGRYFENLVQFGIEQINGFKLIAQNEQIVERGQTRGEIDFVFQSSETELYHCETAVKFYLFHSSETSMGSHFIGPNTSDTLERKIDRLVNWQLPLGTSLFPALKHQIAHVKGIIFYHPDQSPPHSLPEHLSPKHLRGTWIKHCEWDAFAHSSGYRQFKILRKPYWLGSQILQSDSAIEILSTASLKAQLAQHFDQTEHSLMISAFDSDQMSNEECERLFIVADHWPQPLTS